jgi:hypothetical protein
MLQTGLVVLFERWGVDFDAFGFDDSTNLIQSVWVFRRRGFDDLRAA